MQKYIPGITYDKFHVPNCILFQSAEILGKINSTMEDIDYLKMDFPIDWLKTANSSTDMGKLEEIIHMAEELPSESYKSKIIDDCKWKLSIMPEIAENRNSFLQLTRKNSHGDYNTHQWICDKDKIKSVVDFGSCGNIPIIWELIRSYTYSGSECVNGDNIDVRNYMKYIEEYQKTNFLNDSDFKHGFAFYLFSLLPSSYGYKEYIKDFQRGNKNDIIYFAFWRTNMCRFLYENANELDSYIYRNMIK